MPLHESVARPIIPLLVKSCLSLSDMRYRRPTDKGAAQAMYLQHFKLSEPPFNLTPGTRFLYWTPGHRQALDHLLYGIRQRKGFIVLTGEVGSGKTTLCRHLLNELGPDHRTALVLNPMLSETQLLRLILMELGMDDAKGDKLALRARLNQYLLDQAACGNDVVLIIDEAQNLSREMLEHIRLLSNLETESHKLIQIVLVGQPELRQTLGDHRLRQLRQRITVYFHLTGMSSEDTIRYVNHRIKVAGGSESARFDPEALRLVHQFSEGIPRRVNAVSDMAMLSAYGRGQDRVDVAAVEAAVKELQEIGQ